jgi:hypothetical protein
MMARKHLSYKVQQDGLGKVHDSIDIVDLKKEVQLETDGGDIIGEKNLEELKQSSAEFAALTGIDNQELDQLREMVADYVVTNPLQARDFSSQVPILTKIGAEDYDKAPNMASLNLTIEEALKKFRYQWKTLNPDKISYLMQIGLVQEVMKVEERKSIRRQMDQIRRDKAEHLAEQRA